MLIGLIFLLNERVRPENVVTDTDDDETTEGDAETLEITMWKVTCLYKKRLFVQSHSVNLSTKKKRVLFFVEHWNLKVEAVSKINIIV